MFELPAHLANYVVDATTLCLLFYGTLRLAERRSGKLTVFLLSIGLLIGSAEVVKYHWMSSLMANSASLLHREKSPLRELPQEWGKDLSPAQRAQSIIVARLAFDDHGRLIEYVEENGNRIRFVPTEEDIRRRDAIVSAAAKFDELSAFSKMQMSRWVVMALTALAAGYFFGRSIRVRRV